MNKRLLPILIILLIISGISLRSQAQSLGQTATAAPTQSATLGATQAATQQPFTLLNMNTGTDEQVLTIPGMNNRMVREYMEYRPYVSILQFRKEIGKYVGEEQTAAWEKYIYVPIQVDQADAETLKQIPGVTDDIAKELIAARPYNTNETFLTKLATYLTPAQTIFAANYLEGDVTIPASLLTATASATQSATATAPATATAQS